jgi:multicomponent Na+:H+ antiporter subunit A
MSWLAILVLILVVVMVAAAIFAITRKDLIIAVIGTSVISVVLSVLFYILQAPDVALTEAAIGVALSTIIFVIAIKKTDRYEE